MAKVIGEKNVFMFLRVMNFIKIEDHASDYTFLRTTTFTVDKINKKKYKNNENLSFMHLICLSIKREGHWDNNKKFVTDHFNSKEKKEFVQKKFITNWLFFFSLKVEQEKKIKKKEEKKEKNS